MWKINPKSAPLKRTVQLTSHSGQWHAVSVISERYCCDAARALLGRRFLAAEAPRLPLQGCTSGEACTCKYRHYEDRRGQPRRKEDISGLRRRDPGGADRRVGQCRRLKD
jgi:hypothetical protein